MEDEVLFTIEIRARKYDPIYNNIILLHNGIQLTKFFDEEVMPKLEELQMTITNIKLIENKQ